VFASVRIHADSEQGNTFYVASNDADLRVLHEPDFSDVHHACLASVRESFAGLRETHPDHGRVLTDNYNPDEYYDAANRERIRRNLAMGVRGL
jgi:hypothetical protein